MFDLKEEFVRVCPASTNDAKDNFLVQAYTVGFSDRSTIHELFENQALRSPKNIAVKFGHESITYQELSQQSNRVAEYLVNKGTKSESVVGICMHRSLEMVVGILGVLKAGAAYLPIDPNYPQNRIDYLVEDAKLSFVLTQSSLTQKLQRLVQNVCVLDESFFSKLSQEAATYYSDEDLAGSLAYIIYTSGSTGNPKGVMVEHRALINRIEWMKNEYGCDDSDVILQKTSFSFDVSVWEFFLPLISGATLVLAEPEGHKNPTYLSEIIKKEKVTKVHFVPSMLSAFLSVSSFSDCTSLKQIFCSGEALLGAHVDAYFKDGANAELHNLYGPTEAAIDVSFWKCTPNDVSRSIVPIGRAIQNLQLYVLNSQFDIVPKGVSGELYIGGVGLARAYLNKPDITSDRFLIKSINEGVPTRLYKTGDLCCYLPDGNIEYLGRIDHQVKIRGHRIELGEIENVLMRHPHISDAVVISAQSKAALVHLTAYVVITSEISTDSLFDYLRLYLPDFMMPAFIRAIPEIPLTPNGKADRESLRNFEFDTLDIVSVANELTLFQGEIFRLWEKILGFANYGIDDDLFKIGGDSISAVRIFGLINDEFGISLPIQEIFSSHSFTIRNLAKIVENYQISLLGENEYKSLINELESLSEQDLVKLLNS